MRTGNYRHAELVYSDEYGELKIDNVGFRTHGNTTRSIPEDKSGYHRSNFVIKFDETFDLAEGTRDYKGQKSRYFCGLDKIMLNWGQWTDLSSIRELYCYDLLNNAGLAAPKASLASLDIVIGGKKVHYGVYTMIEPVDERFLTSRYGAKSDDGNLFKCTWEDKPATLEEGTENLIGLKDWETDTRFSYTLETNTKKADFGDLKLFIDKINDLGDADFARYIEEKFDADSFLRVSALNVLLGDVDDYRTMANNYYLYFNNRGKIVFIPFDYNAAMAAGWDGDRFWSFEGIASGDIYAWKDFVALYTKKPSARPLFDRIISIDAYRQKYEYYLKYYIDSGLFSYDSFVSMFNAQKALYGDLACSDTEDTGEEMKLTNGEWYFNTKIKSVLDQLGK
jgi:spore coat protein H